MKLNETRPYLETSGELEEEFFSIQDQGMIFDILRNKMYSNPILAICREISCNARDAHREVGTPDVPVHIYLPNTLEPYYKVKDFGPGISPDRMVNIFIKYTASTKRSDNLQTGGFGLGAKTPFSYSDSFSIVTNYNGVQYNYSCNIDETKVGKMSLMSESRTTEPNGTTIIIPVLPKNFQEFATWTEQACRHWEVKPVIKGGSIAWEPISKILSGNEWAIISSRDYYNHDCKVIVDGIEYPLDLDSLKKYADSALISSIKGKLIMYFGVGELSLSANREQIYLDEPTQKVIRERLDLILKEVKSRVQDKVDSFDNLWDAMICYRKELKQAFNNTKFLGQLCWQDIELTDQYVYTGCPTFSFTKGKYSRKYGTDPNKLSRTSTNVITYDENCVLYLNDLSLKEPTPKHIKKAFEQDAKLEQLIVICPTDKVTVDTLNEAIHLDKLKPRLLSSITKSSGRKYTAPTSRLLLFKYDKSAACFRQASYSSYEEDGNTKVLCTLHRSNYGATQRYAQLKNGKALDHHSLNTLLENFPDYSFYGVDYDAPQDRVEEEFSDLADIESFATKYLANQKFDFVKAKFASGNGYVSGRDRALMTDTKLKLASPDSLFVKRLNLLKDIEKIEHSKYQGLLKLYEAIYGTITSDDIELWVKNNPDMDIVSLTTKVEKTYPLLDSLQTWNYKEILPHIVHYINLVDKELGESK